MKRNHSSFEAVSSFTEHWLHLVSVNWKEHSFRETLKSFNKEGNPLCPVGSLRSHLPCT